MATEKRLIDARYLTSQMYLICEAFQTENIFIDAIIDEIDNAPDVDAVEVVRCKDCKHCYKSTSSSTNYRCKVLGVYDTDCEVTPEHYCSYGERKDNA